MSSSGRPPMASMHFGVVSVIGLRRLPIPAARRKAFTPAALPDDPEGTHPRVRLGQHAVEAVHALEPFGVRGDRVGRRALRLPAQRPQGADVRHDVPGVAEAVLAGHHAGLGRNRTGA